MNAERSVVMAAVAGAHGITGEVKLKLFTGAADQLKQHRQFDAGGKLLTLVSARAAPHGAVARFAEITDRSQAEVLRGTLLTVPRSSLPPLAEGEYYWHDLVGLAVVDEADVAVGVVVAVENYGASDLLEIDIGKRRILIPMTPDAVLEMDESKVRVSRAYVDAA